MKKISSWIIALTLISPFLFSCSTDEELVIKPQTTALKRCLQTPKNNANPYDTIGRIQNQVLDICLSANHNHSTIEQINGEIELITNNYGNTSIGNSTQAPFSIGLQINNIVNAPQSSLNTIIANSHLTNQAKTNLSGFINSLLFLKNEEYEDIYEFIITYESSIVGNMVFNNEDKRIILTISSLARYSFYYEKKRKDKDWETSVGNIVASISGALENSLTAVSMALVTGISQNTIVTE